MKRLLGICISMQMTFVLLFISGIYSKVEFLCWSQHLFDHWVCKSGDQLIFSR